VRNIVKIRLISLYWPCICIASWVYLIEKIIVVHVCNVLYLSLFYACLEFAGDCKTFLYQFTHRPSFSHSPEWVTASHGNEIPYVIGEPFLDRLPDIWSEDERRLSATVMAMWSSFARTGYSWTLPYFSHVFLPILKASEISALLHLITILNCFCTCRPISMNQSINQSVQFSSFIVNGIDTN